MALPVITLTTDLGYKDYYVPAVKGYIYSRLPGANIADITHEIKPFRLDEASFILRGCFEEFPKGSIHIISVDTSQVGASRFLAVKARGHFFVCHDNGMVSLLVGDEEVEEIAELPFNDSDLIFSMKSILAPAAVHISEKGSLAGLGTPTTAMVRRANMRPLIEGTIIRGAVIYIDNLGNAITNIDRENFERFRKDRAYRISISRSEYFDNISTHYNEVPEGEKVCLFTSNGLLEIAINKGSCTNLLGLKQGHAILIEFE